MLVDLKQKFKKWFTSNFSRGFTSRFSRGFTSSLSRGFSLAEILIVLVIMMIISAVGIYTIQVVGQRSKAQAVAEGLKSIISQARNIAVTGEGTDFNSGINWIGVRIDKTNKIAGIYKVIGGNHELVDGSELDLSGVEKIVFGKLTYYDGTAMAFCDKGTIQDACSIYFNYQGLNPGSVDTFGITQLGSVTDLEVYVVDNFSAGNPEDVIAYSVKTDKYSGNVTLKKVGASLVR